MANGLYLKFKQALGAATHNRTADSMRAILADAAGYTAVLATHDFLAMRPGMNSA